MSHLRNLGNHLSIPISPDEGGYISRGRPIVKCRGHFKIIPGTGVKGAAPCYCPYCGHSGASNTLFTQEQIEYAKSVVLRRVTEAHYVCALLNSSMVQLAVISHAVSTQISTHVTEHIGIQAFDKEIPTHRRLAQLSQACHAAPIRGAAKPIALLEAQVDGPAAGLWGITDDEVKAIQKALAENEGLRSRPMAGRDDDDNQ